MQNARLDETQAEIKIVGRNINNLRYADDTLFTETWSHHVVLSLTFWLNYSASFLH